MIPGTALASPRPSGLTWGWTFPFGPIANAVAAFGNHVYFAGEFLSAGHREAMNITRWEAPLPSGVSVGTRPILDVTARPNPSRGPVSFQVPAAGGSKVIIDIVTPTGRHVRRLEASGSESRAGQLVWDGRDGRGRLLPPGVYLARCRNAEGFTTVKLLRLK